MVSKLWCQEIGRRWRQRRQEPPHARLLTQPKYKPHVTVWYLLYRWIIFLLWTTLVVCSILGVGSRQLHHEYAKWPIYLTNWDITLGFSQALTGGILVSKRWRLQLMPEFDPRVLKFEFTERMYWFLYVATTSVALGVTVVYWVAVYDPAEQFIDPQNIMVHVCNSVLMLTDLFVTSMPFRLRDFWWCLSIILFYLVFSLIYYLAGGLGRNDHHYIYKILDWKRPVRTVLVCAGGLIFATLLHCVVCMMVEARDRLYHRIAKRRSVEPEQPTITSDKAPSEKRTETV